MPPKKPAADPSADLPRSRKKDPVDDALAQVKRSVKAREAGGGKKRPIPAMPPDEVPVKKSRKPASGAPKVRKSKPRSRKAAAAPSWRRWLLAEALTVTAGATAGLALTGGLLWSRAARDVDAYLAAPPRPVPSVVWSAPMEIRPGMRASVPAIAGDLLAAGYERVERVVVPESDTDGVGVFAVTGDGLDVWTRPASGPGGDVTGGRATIRIRDGLVVGPSKVVLRPTVLGTIGDLEGRRTPVKLGALSKWVEPALLSMEDTRFRQHHGVDPIGVARALFGNLLGRDVQGGSTLTQQLAKNLFLDRDRTVRRKVREAFFAAALEHRLSKDELLELYLSEVYLGQMGGLPLHGVDAAARAWFGVSASRLELHQAATLIGAIPAPNAWSPVRHPEASLQRRDVVLTRMRDLGLIDAETHAAATARPLDLQGLEPSRIRRAPYAVDAAVDRAELALGDGALAARGYQVHTAIQPLLQRAAEEAVAAGMAELDAEYPKAAGAEVALVAVRVRDGAVVAMVGGRSYARSPFNRARDAHRQAGSTVKPLTMLKAFEDGKLTPASRLEDQPISRVIDGTTWTPHNYDGTWAGEVTVREAIEASRNIPAIHMAETVGATRLQRFYRDAGLSDATHLPSAALGSFAATPLELVGAYTAFDKGFAYRPRTLIALTDADGKTVLTLPAEGQPLADEKAAAQAMRVLTGVIESGTGARAARYGVGAPAGGKTGTTDDYRDAWFVGLTPELVIAVWVGRDQGTLGLSGSRAALPTWARFVAASGTLQTPARRPEGLVEVAICDESGLPARDACPARHTDLFSASQVPKDRCDLHGGPQVKAGPLLGRLFGRKDRSTDPEGVQTGVE